MQKANFNEIADVLEKPAYMELLLCLISGKNYATAIARSLKKKQPTVTEQLKELEKLGLIKPLGREKSKKFEVDWNLLLKLFYNIIEEVFELRMEYLSKTEIKRVKETTFTEVIPPELVKAFLKEYFLTVLELGGKRKGFDEIIFSFFSALNNLERPYLRKIVKKFGTDEKSLSTLSHLMEFEISGIEQTALMTYLDLVDVGR